MEEEKFCLKLKDESYVDAGKFKSFKKNQKGITVMCWFNPKSLKKDFHIINQGGGWQDKVYFKFFII
jgi:hypothetical protein